MTPAGQGTTESCFVLDWTGSTGPSPGTSTSDVAWNVWAQLTGSRSLTTRFMYGNAADQLFAQIGNGSGVTWNLTDHLGSTRDVIDNNGNVLDAINYDAFGNITSQSSVANQPLTLYTGRQWDAVTGLQYNRDRWYDPSSQRWISQDPMGFDAGDSNLYRYVNNGPTDATDPSGLDEILIRGSEVFWNVEEAAPYPPTLEPPRELAWDLASASCRTAPSVPDTKPNAAPAAPTARTLTSSLPLKLRQAVPPTAYK